MSARTKSNTPKPVKVNNWETNALKNALDDACKKYFKETLSFTEDHTLMDRRLYISLIACCTSLAAMAYDWYNPFPKSRLVLILCVISYFIIIGFLTFHIYLIERGRFFTGIIIDKTGISPGIRCKISSKLKKYDDKYNLTMEYNDGEENTPNASVAFSSSVGNYFDEEGILHYDRYVDDLKKVYDQVRSNTSKAK